MIAVILWMALLGTITAAGRIDDSDFTDPDINLQELEKFSPAPADLPQGQIND